MAILLTNDDGVHAKGIRALYTALSTIDTVIIIAPHVQRSACSHSVIFDKSVEMTQLSDTVYSLESTPADCVRAGLKGALTEKIELVVSGINHGANLGYDIHYSGTVAAAREAYIQGRTGIAFSLTTYEPDADFTHAAGIARDIVASVLRKGYAADGKHAYLNVNIPFCKPDAIAGSVITKLAVRRYEDFVEIEEREGMKRLVSFIGVPPEGEYQEGTDCCAVKENYISITPLSLFCHSRENFSFLQEDIHI